MNLNEEKSVCSKTELSGGSSSLPTLAGKWREGKLVSFIIHGFQVPTLLDLNMRVASPTSLVLCVSNNRKHKFILSTYISIIDSLWHNIPKNKLTVPKRRQLLVERHVHPQLAMVTGLRREEFSTLCTGVSNPAMSQVTAPEMLPGLVHWETLLGSVREWTATVVERETVIKKVSLVKRDTLFSPEMEF